MQIVINILEDEYNKICSGNFDINGYFKMNLKEAFKNAIPLPKGYGRLIDADGIQFENAEFDTYGDYCRVCNAIDLADTILESDKAESEE